MSKRDRDCITAGENIVNAIGKITEDALVSVFLMSVNVGLMVYQRRLPQNE